MGAVDNLLTISLMPLFLSLSPSRSSSTTRNGVSLWQRTAAAAPQGKAASLCLSHLCEVCVRVHPSRASQEPNPDQLGLTFLKTCTLICWHPLCVYTGTSAEAGGGCSRTTAPVFGLLNRPGRVVGAAVVEGGERQGLHRSRWRKDSERPAKNSESALNVHNFKRQ